MTATDIEKIGSNMGPGTGGPISLIGRDIAGYRIEEEKGSGSNGIVFRARRIGDDADKPEQVAIKILLPNVHMGAEDRSNFQKRFLREAKTLQQLRHPNIVSVIEFGEQDELSYMILPYLSGGTLAQKIADHEYQITLPDADRYIGQLASAIDYAHERGVIHRDIKPQNVLLDDEGNAHLADFGLVLVLDKTRSQASSARFAVGTPAYMAPEQFDPTKAGNASDIYSLGAVAYELVTRRTPFDGDSLMEIIRKIASEPPARPTLFRSDLPEPAEAVIWQALNKQPEARFESATEMAHAFSAGLHGDWTPGVNPIILPEQTPSQPGSLQFSTTLPPITWSSQYPTLPPTRKRGRILVTALAGAVVLLLISTLALAHNGLGALLSPSSSPGTPNIGQSSSTGTTGNDGAAPTATPTRHTSSGGSGGSGSKPVAKPTATPRPSPTATIPPTVTPRPPTPTPKPSKTITVGWSSAHPPWIWIKYSGFSNGTYQWTCNFSNSSGGDVTTYTYTMTITANPMTVDNGQTCWDKNPGEKVWVNVGPVVSNKLTVP
jgi:serine/threonine protein kinase